MITLKELRYDTQCFFYKQISTIFFLSIFITCINVLIDMLIKPEMHIISIIEKSNFISTNRLLESINNMNFDEKKQLLKYSILKTIALLMNKTFFLSSLITLISSLSKNKKESIISLIYSCFFSLPSLFILNFMITFIAQLGYLLLFILGIFLTIILSLSPIIFHFKKHSLIDSIRLSMYISCKNIRIIAPGVLFWIFGKLMLTVLFSNIYIVNKNIIFFILNININILYAILIIFLFRFYMLLIRC